MVSKESSINKMLIVILYALLFSVTYLLLFSFGGKNASAALSLSGSGTSTNPYKISSPADLKNFRDYVNNGNTMSGQYIELTCDIDMNNEPFICIGYTRTGNNSKNYSFNGIFDGKNHVLQNLTLQSSTGDQYSGFPNGGLFANTINATIKNLFLKNVNAYDFGWYSGALIGDANNTTIENIYVLSGSVVSDSINGDYATGGIVGYAHDGTSMNFCFNYASVSSSSIGYRTVSGGVVGAIGAKLSGNSPTYSSASISKCGNFGSVVAKSTTGWESYAGGVAGYAGCKIENCFNQGSVNSDANFVYDYGFAGGIVGYSNSECSKCYNTGTITGGYTKTSKTEEYVLVGGVLGIGRKVAYVTVDYYQVRYANINGNYNAFVSDCYGTNTISYSATAKLTIKENDSYGVNGKNCSEISGSYTYTFSNKYYCYVSQLSYPDNRSREPHYNINAYIYNKKNAVQASYSFSLYPLKYTGTQMASATLKSDLPSGFSSDVWAIHKDIFNGYPHFKGKYWADYVVEPYYT